MLNEKNITALLAFFFVIFALGFVFHQSPTFAGSLAGHLIGIFGTAIMIMALIYPFRKRILKKRGKENPLNPHIYYGLIGPSLVLFHSSHKFSSLIGLLCFIALFFVVLSGIVGKILFRKVNRTLKEQKEDLQILETMLRQRKSEAQKCRLYLETDKSEDTNGNLTPNASTEIFQEDGQQTCEVILNIAQSIAELEQAVQFFSQTKKLFSRWIGIHYAFTLFLFAMVAVHILTSIYYGFRWLP